MQPEPPSLALDCTACGAALTAAPHIHREITTLHADIAQLHHVLHQLKPMLITASYYLHQHAHLLQAQAGPVGDDPALQVAREAQARTLSSELMDAYGRVTEALARAAPSPLPV